jgi:DNA polymerase III alpha subunit (gram-positive type)
MRLAFCGFDLEATGKKAHLDDITQVGAFLRVSAVCPETGRALDIDLDRFDEDPGAKYASLVHTSRELSAEVKELTGIKSVQEARSFGEVAEEFAGWLNAQRAGLPLCFVTYNGMGFDMPMFARHLVKAGVNVQRWFASVGAVAHNDELPVAQYNALPGFKLGDVYEQVFGHRFANAHTGDGDARATLRLFFCQHRDLRTGLLGIDNTLFYIARDTILRHEDIFVVDARPESLQFGAHKCVLPGRIAVPPTASKKRFRIELEQLPQ